MLVGRGRIELERKDVKEREVKCEANVQRIHMIYMNKITPVIIISAFYALKYSTSLFSIGHSDSLQHSRHLSIRQPWTSPCKTERL